MSYNPQENKIEGMMNDNELVWLHNKASEMNSVVEIGSWMGRSTHALLTGCKGKVHSVDHFKGSADPIETGNRDVFPDFQKNVGQFDNLVIHIKDSVSASSDIDNSDMVFIDGGHQYGEVVADINAWLPKADKLLCGHDIQAPQVVKGVYDTIGMVETFERIWFLDATNPLYVLTKKIKNNENFSFIKMGDGEILAMSGVSGSNCDGQKYTKELAKALKSAYKKIGKIDNVLITKWKLGMNIERVAFEKELGIKCEADHDLLLNRIDGPTPYHFNFWKAIKDSDRRKIFVGPARLKGVINFLSVDEFVEIPQKDAFSFKPNISVSDNDIVLFSAGLASKVWISEIISDKITCIDCGSAFDPIFIGRTRTKQAPQKILFEFYRDLLNMYSNKKLKEMFSLPQETHPERVFVANELGDAKNIIDIGCGLHKTVPNAIGVDIIKGVEVVASADDLPVKSDSVDVIISRHSFEHLLNSVKVIKEWLRVLKSGGRIIMILPDHGRLDTMDNFLSGGKHLHAFTRESLSDFLSMFNDVEILKTGSCVENWSFYCIIKKK